MSEDELRAIEARRDADIARFRVEFEGDREVRLLIGEVRRLRGLLKEHEFCMAVPVNTVSNSGDRYECAACCRTARERHAADCPAFTPEGSVR